MTGVSSLLTRLPGRAGSKLAAPATVTVDSAKFKGTLIAKDGRIVHPNLETKSP